MLHPAYLAEYTKALGLRPDLMPSFQFLCYPPPPYETVVKDLKFVHNDLPEAPQPPTKRPKSDTGSPIKQAMNVVYTTLPVPTPPTPCPTPSRPPTILQKPPVCFPRDIPLTPRASRMLKQIMEQMTFYTPHYVCQQENCYFASLHDTCYIQHYKDKHNIDITVRRLKRSNFRNYSSDGKWTCVICLERIPGPRKAYLYHLKTKHDCIPGCKEYRYSTLP